MPRSSQIPDSFWADIKDKLWVIRHQKNLELPCLLCAYWEIQISPDFQNVPPQPLALPEHTHLLFHLLNLLH